MICYCYDIIRSIPYLYYNTTILHQTLVLFSWFCSHDMSWCQGKRLSSQDSMLPNQTWEKFEAAMKLDDTTGTPLKR